MKHLLLTLLVGCTLTGAAAAQEPDFRFSTQVDETYASYLATQDAALLAVILDPGSASEYDAALMGRALVLAARIHVELDAAADDMEPVVDDLDARVVQEVEQLYEDHLQDLDTSSPHRFAEELSNLLMGAGQADVRAQVRAIVEALRENTDTAADIVDVHARTMEDYLEDIADHLDALAEGSAAFTVTFVVDGSGVEGQPFEVTRANVDDVESLLDVLETTVEELDDAQRLLDDLIEGRDDVATLTQDLQQAVGHLQEANALLQTMVTTQPLAPLGIELDAFYAVDDVLDEVAAILEGRTYDLDDEGTTIRPWALVEALPGGIERLILDFYRLPVGSRAGYTAYGLFPQGLPSDVIEGLEEDMVLNAADDAVAFRMRARTLKAAFLARLGSNSEDGEAALGVASLLVAELISDHRDDLIDAIDAVADGDIYDLIDVLAALDVPDYTAKGDSIAEYIDRAAGGELFIALVKLDEGGSYGIGEGDDFVPIVLHDEVFDALSEPAYALVDAGEEAVAAMGDVLEELDTVVDTYLDPNELDLSEASSPLDVVAALRQANPTFLALRDGAADRLQNAGEDLRDVMADYATSMHHLRQVVDSLGRYAGYEDHTVMDVMATMDDLAQQMRDDFANPSSTTRIAGEEVDLSAWFFAPPSNFLTAFEWFIDEDEQTDNTLGGLFPERGTGTSTTPGAALPEAFASRSIFPNPARGSAYVSVDLPQPADVRLQVYDVLGRLHATVEQRLEAGKRQLAVDLSAAPNGTYLCRVEAGPLHHTHRLVVVH